MAEILEILYFDTISNVIVPKLDWMKLEKFGPKPIPFEPGKYKVGIYKNKNTRQVVELCNVEKPFLRADEMIAEFSINTNEILITDPAYIKQDIQENKGECFVMFWGGNAEKAADILKEKGYKLVQQSGVWKFPKTSNKNEIKKQQAEITVIWEKVGQRSLLWSTISTAILYNRAWMAVQEKTYNLFQVDDNQMGFVYFVQRYNGCPLYVTRSDNDSVNGLWIYQGNNDSYIDFIVDENTYIEEVEEFEENIFKGYRQFEPGINIKSAEDWENEDDRRVWEISFTEHEQSWMSDFRVIYADGNQTPSKWLFLSEKKIYQFIKKNGITSDPANRDRIEVTDLCYIDPDNREKIEKIGVKLSICFLDKVQKENMHEELENFAGLMLKLYNNSRKWTTCRKTKEVIYNNGRWICKGEMMLESCEKGNVNIYYKLTISKKGFSLVYKNKEGTK